jgi:hypothetical protein
MLCFVGCKLEITYSSISGTDSACISTFSQDSALLLTYGFPLTIIGIALKARNFLYVHRHLQKGPYDCSLTVIALQKLHTSMFYT